MRLRRIFRPSERSEVEDELRFHIEMRTRELIEQGEDPPRARAMAEERFGPVRPIEIALVDSTRRRRQREERAEVFMNLTQDLSYAFRSLKKNPAFAAAAIATLALGVGATLAVFTVVNGVLLRPLPYKDPSRIDMIWITSQGLDGVPSDLPLTSGFFTDIERQSKSFEAMAAFRSWPYALAHAAGSEPEQVSGARVSPALFDVLGVHPAAGRAFTRQDAKPGAPHVALISHDLWHTKFGGDQGIVGKQVYLSGASFTITGVMPAGFAFPRGAELPSPFGFGLRTDVWTPLVFDSTDLRNYGTMNLSAVGRRASAGPSPSLRSGSERQRAQAELSGIMKRFLAENAPNLKLDYRLVSIADQAGNKVKRGLLILLGAVVFVLLIAAANVASLLVARVANRQRELAVRAALGAGRGRIARQLVTENLVLAVSGTAIGVVIAFWATKVMLALVPGSMPRADDIGLDWRVLSFAAAVALLTGIAFGIAAAYSVRWSRLSGMLHSGDTRSTGSIGHRYGRRLLVATEVALSLMLLIGAALLTRSFIRLQQVRPGFDATNVLTAGMSIPIAGRFAPADDGPAWARTFDEVTARLGSAPGVVAAGAVSALPLTGSFESGGVRPVGRTYEPGQGPTAQYNVVAGDYFGAAGIRMIAGRQFDASDAATGRASIIVNREYARKQFGSETGAIGREVNATFEFTRNRPPRTIVGVADDVKQMSLDDEPASQVYVPVSQMAYPGLTLVLRTSGQPLGALAIVRREVRAVNPAATVNDVRTMESVVSHSLARQRFSMTLIAVFAALALVLAIVGLYGVLALIVGQRRREIGVRLALGAKPSDVVWMVVSEGARVTAVGVVLGIGGSLALTRVLGSLLYGISTTDVVTFVGAGVVVAIVALGATFAPARRAARVDPKAALMAD
ncbi:MAG: ABC transporter permease [Gemmatimonadaceae bacterium]